MRNRMYGGVRGRKMKVGGKLLHFPPTRLLPIMGGMSNLHVMSRSNGKAENCSIFSTVVEVRGRAFSL